MNAQSGSILRDFAAYSQRLQTVLDGAQWDGAVKLAEAMRSCWRHGRRVFFCGNGGSAANAMHLANDFLYSVAKGHGPGIRVMALSDNPALVTCLANDTGYDNIFAGQLEVQGSPGDVLVALSGSGNSPNVLRALEKAREMDITGFAILGFCGGKAKDLARHTIHFPVDDMQVSEDLQLIVGHMIMQWLSQHPPRRG